MSASWSKLLDGSWGVLVAKNEAAAVTNGSIVTVTKRSGERKNVQLGSKVATKNWGDLYRVGGSNSTRRPQRQYNVAMVICQAYGCGAEAERMGYCRQCYFDEVDA